jgi:inosine/xanthosine triphosphatase
VASLNPTKIEAARRGYTLLFGPPTSLRGLSVDSGVAAQPIGDDETYRGAAQRAEAARSLAGLEDLVIAIEGGVEEGPIHLMGFAWVVVDVAGAKSAARSAAFPLPEAVAQLVRGGMELGAADDFVFGRTNSKHQDGAIGILSGGAIDRIGLYAPAVAMALLPWKEVPPTSPTAPDWSADCRWRDRRWPPAGRDRPGEAPPRS